MKISVMNTSSNYENQIKSQKAFDRVVNIDFSQPNDYDFLIDIILNNIHSYRVYTHNQRSKINVELVTGIILDFDSGDTIQQFQQTKLAKYFHILYSSRNHLKQKNGKTVEKFHVVFPVSIDDMRVAVGVQRGVMDAVISEGLTPDENAKDLARVFFPSSLPNELPNEAKSRLIYDFGGTDPLPVEEFKYEISQKIQRTLGESSPDKLKSAVEFLTNHNQSVGLTYHEWLSIAGALVAQTNGEAMFRQISFAYAKATESEVTGKWNNAQQLTQFTISSLYYTAYKHGWRYFGSGELELTLENVDDITAQLVEKAENQFKKSLGATYCHIILEGAKYRLLSLGRSSGKYKLMTSDIPQTAITNFLPPHTSAKELKLVKSTIEKVFTENRYVTREPYLITECGLEATYNQKFTPSELEDHILNTDYVVSSFDRFGGRLSAKQPLADGELGSQMKADYVRAILAEIFSSGDFNYLPIIEKFLAQLAFENRTVAKPTLVLTGARNTGKSFFINHIAGALYDDSVRTYSQSNFNDWSEAKKIISVEESGEVKNDLKRLYNDIKDYSGSQLVTVNKKFLAPYMTPATAYFIVSTNDKFGIYIADNNDIDNNQFVIVDFIKSQAKVPGSNWWNLDVSPEKIKAALKSYVSVYLLPLYLEMQDDKKYRYGFNTTIMSDSLKTVLENSKTFLHEGVEEFEDLLWDVCEGNAGDNILRFSKNLDYMDLKKHISAFKINGFLSNALFDTIYKACQTKAKKNRVRALLKDQEVFFTEARVRVGNSRYRGYNTNLYTRLTTIFGEPEEAPLPF